MVMTKPMAIDLFFFLVALSLCASRKRAAGAGGVSCESFTPGRWRLLGREHP
jgi:hypothetical protein